jgi:hypothetical protein
MGQELVADGGWPMDEKQPEIVAHASRSVHRRRFLLGSLRPKSPDFVLSTNSALFCSGSHERRSILPPQS